MKRFHSRQGFTLLEVVISLSLLVMIFGGVVSLIIMTSEAEKTAKNQLIASYLAQEALELLRYKRDLNYILVEAPFHDISSEVDNTPYSFTLNYDGTVAAAGTDVTAITPLNLSTFYTHAAVTPATNFRRLVTTTYHDAAGPLPIRIDISVQVYWKDDTKSDTYTLTSELMDID